MYLLCTAMYLLFSLCIYIYKWSRVIHDTQGAQISQKQDEHNIHHVPKCMRCLKAIVVIITRAHYFRDCIYMFFYVFYIYRCSLCLHKKLTILMYLNQSELLNKRWELVSKCWHENRLLLQTFISDDGMKNLYSLMSSSQLK